VPIWRDDFLALAENPLSTQLPLIMGRREAPDDHTWLDAGFLSGARLMLIYLVTVSLAVGWLIS